MNNTGYIYRSKKSGVFNGIVILKGRYVITDYNRTPITSFPKLEYCEEYVNGIPKNVRDLEFDCELKVEWKVKQNSVTEDYVIATTTFRDIFFYLGKIGKNDLHNRFYGISAIQNNEYIGGTVHDSWEGGEIKQRSGIFRERIDEELKAFINKLFVKEIKEFQDKIDNIIKTIQTAIKHDVRPRELERLYGYEEFEKISEKDILNDIQNGKICVKTRDNYLETVEDAHTFIKTPYVLIQFQSDNKHYAIGIF